MAQQFFEELSRCLRKEQIESYNKAVSYTHLTLPTIA